MRVRFWGVRGSIAKPGSGTLRHGGNTACVEARSVGGDLIVIDCGTGAHELGRALVGEGPRRGALFVSHTHWDHIQGFPFFAPLFAKGWVWDVYAPRGLNRSLRETLAGQMESDYFPVRIEDLGASIRYHEIVEGEFRYGGVTVRTRWLDHPALTLGYRLEADGASFVYASDHESTTRAASPDAETLAETEAEHVAFLRGADLVAHDAQYTAEEYPARVGWGHATPDYAVAAAAAAGVKRLALTHHDPLRDDAAVDAIVDAARRRAEAMGGDVDVFAAAEGASFDLLGAPAEPKPETDETAPEAERFAPRRAVLVGLRPEVEAVFAAAAAAEGMEVARPDGAAAAVAEAGAEPRGVIVAEAEAGEALAAAVRAGAEPPPPTLLVSPRAAGTTAPGAERIVWPFGEVYARARLRAAAFGGGLRWALAGLPPDETERLGALRALKILDTAREERFDRIARIAAAAFHVPIAAINLIDADRQWAKACVGAPEVDGPREEAFCAHAILEPEPMIVPDALEDARFADNPWVTGEPRIRFYAGSPVRAHGRAVGTLCVVDTRPRRMEGPQIALLRDLARLVEAELAAG